MSKAIINPDCPCPSDCPRHGNCVACREAHHSKGGQTYCEKHPETKKKQ